MTHKNSDNDVIIREILALGLFNDKERMGVKTALQCMFWSRQSGEFFFQTDRKSRNCRINVNSVRLQREMCVYIVILCREIVANNSRTSLQLSHSSEIGA